MTTFFLWSGVAAWALIGLVFWVTYVDDYIRIRLGPRGAQLSVLGWGLCVWRIHPYWRWKPEEMPKVNPRHTKSVVLSGWIFAAGEIDRCVEPERGRGVR